MARVQCGANSGIGCFFADGLSTGFGRDSYEMTLNIDKLIEVGLSNWYFGVFSDDKHEGIVIGGQYGFNSGVVWCVVGGWYQL